jgi:ferritin-like protein
MTTTSTVRRGAPKRPRSAVLTHDDLLQLLNDDFARECRSIYGYAVFAERLKGKGETRRAAQVERRGKAEVTHALVLCQAIYDFGGAVTAPVDELNAVLNADRVAAAGWKADTVARLTDRARQLRAINEPGLAKRLTGLAAAKRSAPDLAAIVGEGG